MTECESILRDIGRADSDAALDRIGASVGRAALSPEELQAVVAAGRKRREELAWERRAAELVARPVFPPDAETPACYRAWLVQKGFVPHERSQEG